MEFRILGPVELRAGDQQVRIERAKERFLLGVLAMHHGKVVSVRTVIDALWDDPPKQAKKDLHAYLSRLRATLRRAGAEARILTQDGGYRFVTGADELDYARFQDLVRTARAARDAGEHDAAAQALRDALGLWRGEVVQGLATLWMENRREDLEDRERLPGYQALCTIELARGRHQEVLDRLGEVAEGHEHDTTFAALRLAALDGLGRYEDFDACWRQIYDRCAQSFGTGPPRELQDQHRRLLQARDARTPADHTRTQAALRAIPPAQLPPTVSEFVGRAGPLAELDQRLMRAHVNGPKSTLVVVLTGPVGVGKTELGLRWGHATGDRFPHGQLYADLSGYAVSPARAPDGVLAELLESLGVAGAAVPASPTQRSSLFRSMLAGRRVLLFLDNARDSDQVIPLLPGSAHAVVIVTSRHRLTDLVNHHGAYRLALDRFTAAETAELLTALTPEPLPLTAEAAARLTGGLPRAIRILADALTSAPASRPPRPDDLLLAGEADTRTLLASILWSYDSLDAGAARTFRTLSPHSEPALGLAAATALDGTDGDTTRAHLATLCAVHLMSVRDDRYTMDAVTRAAGERLAVKVDPADVRMLAQARLLNWFAEFATSVAETLAPTRPRAPGEPDGYAEAEERLERERAGICVAVRRGAATHLGLVAGLLRVLRPHLTIGRNLPDWLAAHEAVRAAAVAAQDRGCEAEAHAGLARLHHLLGDPGAAMESAHLAVTLFRTTADRRGVAELLLFLAARYGETGAHETATAHAREALAIHADIDEPALAARTHIRLASERAHAGEPTLAAGHLTEAAELAGRLPDPRLRARAVLRLGILARRRDHADAAAGYLREAVDLHARHPGDHTETVTALLELAEAATDRGDHAEALLRARETVGLCRSRADHPRSVRAHVAIVRALAATGRQGDAWTESRRTLDLIDEFPDAVDDYVREQFTKLGLWPLPG
ncbi:BTAD domain-containing putative transcriptional regulator [Amycolatopsis sp. CA-128772]|uniref:AfsR/SARP family transcriptional regulator n=1 Tax=Amycolatopsis sp. CA-128772 TaxID=2073159 RepID=UPI000CD1831D|nr:BTAD domain-containing putative transcriptional regulator [Amycolatopsis sp. CA-128772]